MVTLFEVFKDFLEMELRVLKQVLPEFLVGKANLLDLVVNVPRGVVLAGLSRDSSRK